MTNPKGKAYLASRFFNLEELSLKCNKLQELPQSHLAEHGGNILKQGW